MADWPDLLQPALRGRVGLLDSPRDLVGAALLSLGLSANTHPGDLQRLGVPQQALRQRVLALRKQVGGGPATAVILARHATALCPWACQSTCTLGACCAWASRARGSEWLPCASRWVLAVDDLISSCTVIQTRESVPRARTRALGACKA